MYLLSQGRCTLTKCFYFLPNALLVILTIYAAKSNTCGLQEAVIWLLDLVSSSKFFFCCLLMQFFSSLLHLVRKFETEKFIRFVSPFTYYGTGQPLDSMAYPVVKHTPANPLGHPLIHPVTNPFSERLAFLT